MTDLKYIGDFIAETTRVVAMATDLEVIVCDKNGNVLGDSNLEQIENIDVLSEHSIVRRCINEGVPILLKDNKRENPACAKCKNSSECHINSIVAFPIIDHTEIIGGIGLFAFDEFGKELLNKKYNQLAKFIEHLSIFWCRKSVKLQRRKNCRLSAKEAGFWLNQWMRA